jgi:hypothetical protein
MGGAALAARDETAVPEGVAQTLVDPYAYADDRIHDAYTWLRSNNPLGLAQPDGFDPFWVVTKHADILEISRNNELFKSGVRATTLTNKESLARVLEITGGSPHLVRSLVQMDAPDHLKYRALTQAWFMPQNNRKREEAVRGLAEETATKMLALGGACDFVRDVAVEYPLRVIMQILGVPENDYGRMLRLTQELFGAADPEMSRAMEALTAAQFADIMGMVVADFSAYFETISADRRANPRDDLATLIANAKVDGEPIGPIEATGYYVIVATAGHDTTSSSTAAAMWALATQPGLLDRVRADLSLVPALVEEAIRWATPVKTFMRSPIADTELRGRTIRAGDWLMLCYASGNRDEEVFEDPFAFSIDRTPNKQLAFGFGAHLCLGQHLARMEMRALFEALIPRLAAVELDGEPKLVASTFVNGLKTLPIRFRVA